MVSGMVSNLEFVSFWAEKMSLTFLLVSSNFSKIPTRTSASSNLPDLIFSILSAELMVVLSSLSLLNGTYAI